MNSLACFLFLYKIIHNNLAFLSGLAILGYFAYEHLKSMPHDFLLNCECACMFCIISWARKTFVWSILDSSHNLDNLVEESFSAIAHLPLIVNLTESSLVLSRSTFNIIYPGPIDMCLFVCTISNSFEYFNCSLGSSP